MKILLTWHNDPPDPPYWEWIPELDGLVVSLSSIKPKNIDRMTFRNLKTETSRRLLIVVDSLTSALWKCGGVDYLRLQSWIMHVQRSLGADILVHKDYPLIDRSLSVDVKMKLLRKTIINAEFAVRLADKLGIDVMLVVQGWDRKSYARCAEAFKDLGIKYVGVGSLAPMRSNIIGILRGVREVLGRRVHLHVFGMSSPSVLHELVKLSDSTDISTPIRAAIARECLVVKEGRIKRVKFSLLGEAITDLAFDEISRSLIEGIKNALTARELIRKLAILNAYTLVNYVKKMLR